MGEWLTVNTTGITAAATAVIALTTVATALLTLVLARENRILRKAGTEPEVAAYLAIDERHKECLNLVLKNIGQGPAQNVRVTFDADEDDLKAHNAALHTQLADVPITLLPQGERVVTFLGVGFELMGDQPLKPIDVRIGYEDLNGHRRRRQQRLDVRQFDGLVTLGKPAEHEAAEALASIAENLKHVVRGNTFRLKVETVTREEVRQDQQQLAQRVQERRAEGQGPDGTGPDRG